MKLTNPRIRSVLLPRQGTANQQNAADGRGSVLLPLQVRNRPPLILGVRLQEQGCHGIE